MKTTEQYMDSTHRLGRIFTIGTIILMVGLPTLAAIIFDAFPGFVDIFAASVGLMAIFLPITIAEVFSYGPVLGSSIYITFITGNVLNLKLPVATNAISLLDLQQGTEESDVVSSIAVAASSLVTISIIALGAFLMVPLQPLLTTPEVQVASNYILPALFGALALGILNNNLGGGYIAKGRMKGAVLPVIIVAIIFFVAPMLVQQLQGVLILFLLPITFFTTKYMYNKGIIEVENNKE